MAMNKNDGKLLERELQKALKAYQELTPSFVHRFADTRSARQIIQVQPGDFLWLLPRTPAVLIECKSTVAGATFHNLMSPAQRGKHKLWLRAGHIASVVFADLPKNHVQWWSSRSMFQDDLRPWWEGDMDSLGPMLATIATRLKGVP